MGTFEDQRALFLIARRFRRIATRAIVHAEADNPEARIAEAGRRPKSADASVFRSALLVLTNTTLPPCIASNMSSLLCSDENMRSKLGKLRTL
jgi:hypothetical protein